MSVDSPQNISPPPALTPRWQIAQRRQFLAITLGAIAVYVGFRLLPTGTNLNHGDFAVSGKNSIELCDPANPQFVPVVAARSPVTLTVDTAAQPRRGQAVSGTLTIRTSGGKAVGPQDLLVVHTRPMHLMIVDPTLTDYQHVHPEPGRTAGEWTFAFTPRLAGTYRLFADFTPTATGRSLYANADLAVADDAAAAVSAAATPVLAQHGVMTAAADGYAFELVASSWPITARQPIDLTFRIAAPPGGVVPLQPIMGAYAHLVAFDAARSGFAHLHPNQADPLAAPAREHPALSFKLTIPTAGRYVIWSQVNLAGREVFAPFWFEVVD